MFERKKQAGKIYFLPIDQIRPSPFQARREFSEQELAVQHELPLVGVQLQKPQLVGKGGLRHAQSLGGFGLGAVPQHHHIL